MQRLKGAAGNRGRNLEGTKGFHKYMREADELGEWIVEQMQQATSEEFGTDFEHCQVRGFNHIHVGVVVNTGID